MGGRWAVVGIRCSVFSCGVVVCAVVSTSLGQSDSSSRAGHQASAFNSTVSVVQLKIPEKARTELAKGLSEFAKGHLDEAMKHANTALAVAPKFPNALTLRGYIELRQQEFQGANADLAHAIQEDPSFVLAYLYYGASLNRLGRYDEALIALNHYEQLNPQSWESPYEISKAGLGLHDYQRALDAINRASVRGADIEVAAAVHFVRGRALAGLHRYAAARSELEASITPQTTGTMVELAREVLAVIDREAALASK